MTMKIPVTSNITANDYLARLEKVIFEEIKNQLLFRKLVLMF